MQYSDWTKADLIAEINRLETDIAEARNWAADANLRSQEVADEAELWSRANTDLTQLLERRDAEIRALKADYDRIATGAVDLVMRLGMLHEIIGGK